MFVATQTSRTVELNAIHSHRMHGCSKISSMFDTGASLQNTVASLCTAGNQTSQLDGGGGPARCVLTSIQVQSFLDWHGPAVSVNRPDPLVTIIRIVLKVPSLQ